MPAELMTKWMNAYKASQDQAIPEPQRQASRDAMTELLLALIAQHQQPARRATSRMG